MLLVNDEPINVTIFPDKTSQVWQLSDKAFYRKYAHVVWRFENEAEFLHLAQLKHLLDAYDIKSVLEIPYLPYARQDKKVSNSTTFALSTFASLLNSLSFEAVYITDPHSDKTSELIKNTVCQYPIDQVRDALLATNADLICYPDKGALNKYYDLYSYFSHTSAEKVRDQLTGNILTCKHIGNVYDKNILIVDDICDGGATFKMLAKELLDDEASEVNLFVTHGIFSKGIQTLKDSGISRIFTKDGEVK